jgi:glycosyltransferase involved in cell wall biosynthesis
MERMMKILLVHNFYQQSGGEDVVFEQERRLLERKGHQVITYTRTNQEIEQFSSIRRAGLLKTIISASDSRHDIRTILRNERPDVVHTHNTFMLISPAIYEACADARIPVVQTLHNYRLLCPTVTFYRNGSICEECIEDSLLSGIKHGCYRGSRATTAAVVAMLKFHQIVGTWSKKIDAYIVLTDFARQKFSDNGLPPDKLHVKPNFIDPDPGEREQAGNYALFVGRLSPEKGVSTLIEAWRLLKGSIPLKIVGEGPARSDVEEQAKKHGLEQVEFLGKLGRDEVIEAIKGARFVVVPSLWYEGFPMVLTESFACGVPVIGSRLGAMQELIDDGHIGLHFTPGDSSDLADKARWAWEHSSEMAAMGRNARRKYELEYGADANYRMLMNIYTSVMNAAMASQSCSASEPLEATR